MEERFLFVFSYTKIIPGTDKIFMAGSRPKMFTTGVSSTTSEIAQKELFETVNNVKEVYKVENKGLYYD